MKFPLALFKLISLTTRTRQSRTRQFRVYFVMNIMYLENWNNVLKVMLLQYFLYSTFACNGVLFKSDYWIIEFHNRASIWMEELLKRERIVLSNLCTNYK